MKWTAADIPDQTGRVAIVTGANSGIGLVTARELARKGAEVVLACRNAEKASTALSAIKAAAPLARVDVEALDLSSLASVRAFAERFAESGRALDRLINNAGVMAAPRRLTEDGFETQIGTNHLGHFALTGLLIEHMRNREGARVVTVSSGVHHRGRIAFDDLHGERKYGRWIAYAQSKLANLLFAFELDRRLRAASSPLVSVAAHPGYSATNLQFAEMSKFESAYMSVGNALFAQSADMGALPTLYAATAPGVEGGQYIGPGGMFEMRGHPRRVSAAAAAHDEAVARELWSISERLTGVSVLSSAATVDAPAS